jgi:hypothetical protein
MTFCGFLFDLFFLKKGGAGLLMQVHDLGKIIMPALYFFHSQRLCLKYFLFGGVGKLICSRNRTYWLD